MSDQLDIYVTSAMQRRMVRPAFDLTDLFWPTLIIISIPVAIYLDSSVTMAQGGLQGSVGVVGGMYALLVAAALGVRTLRRWQAHRFMKRQSSQHEQYLAFDHEGIRYGWEGLAHYAIAWKAVFAVEWSRRTLTLLMGRHQLNVELNALQPKQRDDLRAFLASLRDGRPPEPSDADPSTLPLAGPQRIILRG